MVSYYYWTYTDGTIEVISTDIEYFSNEYSSCDGNGESGGGNSGSSEIVIEIPVHINDNNLKHCLKKVMDSIKTLTNDIKGIITAFAGSVEGYNWELNDGSATDSTTAQTSTDYDSSTKMVTTTFDTGNWKDATDLSWARTILHESVHAYVIAVQYNTSTVAEKIELLGENWLNRFTNKGHDFIANHYITPITNALEEFGKKQGYDLDRSYYEDLAWGGLEDTDAFNSYNEKYRASNIISIELTGNDKHGNPKTQKGHKTGC